MELQENFLTICARHHADLSVSFLFTFQSWTENAIVGIASRTSILHFRDTGILAIEGISIRLLWNSYKYLHIPAFVNTSLYTF